MTVNYRNKCDFLYFAKRIISSSNTFSNHGKVCEAAQISLTRAPNELNKLPEVRFEFLFILIGKSTMAFSTGQSWRVLNLATQVGVQNKAFGDVSQTELTRVLVSFVVQANRCLRSSFWFSCTPVLCDCFCGAGYWSSSPSPFPASTCDVSLSTETDIALTELAGVVIWLFQLLFTFTLPRESRITIFVATKRGK